MNYNHLKIQYDKVITQIIITPHLVISRNISYRDEKILFYGTYMSDI